MAYMSWKIAFHASHSRSNDHAALAGLVDGSTVASIYEDFGIFVVYQFKRMDNVFILHFSIPPACIFHPIHLLESNHHQVVNL